MQNFFGMGSPTTEQEIQKHKDKLNNLINKLNNTHKIDEEISINNEIKSETDCISSLLNIKKNEINQNNNIKNNFNPMFNQINMGYNMVNDMMMFKNQNQMIAPQVVNQNDNKWNLIFELNSESKIINVSIDPNKLFKEAISIFLLNIGSGSTGDYQFIFNSKEIYQDMKICQTGLQHLSRILALPARRSKGIK